MILFSVFMEAKTRKAKNFKLLGGCEMRFENKKKILSAVIHTIIFQFHCRKYIKSLEKK